MTGNVLQDSMYGLKVSTFVIGGIFGFQFYGLSFMIVALFAFVCLCVIDTLFGYSIARKNNLVGSKERDNGVYRKITQVCIILVIIMLCGSLANEIQVKSIQIGLMLICFFPLAGFSFAQLTSIIENLGVNAHGKELRYVNILLKIAGIGQKKLEEKLAKYDIPIAGLVKDDSAPQK